MNIPVMDYKLPVCARHNLPMVAHCVLCDAENAGPLAPDPRLAALEAECLEERAALSLAEDEVQRLREAFRGHDKEVLEAMADMEHERWARWFEYQRDNSTPERIERWTLLADKPYAYLTEELKEKDRCEVLRILGAGLVALTPPEAQGREEAGRGCD